MDDLEKKEIDERNEENRQLPYERSYGKISAENEYLGKRVLELLSSNAELEKEKVQLQRKISDLNDVISSLTAERDEQCQIKFQYMHELQECKQENKELEIERGMTKNIAANRSDKSSKPKTTGVQDTNIAEIYAKDDSTKEPHKSNYDSESSAKDETKLTISGVPRDFKAPQIRRHFASKGVTVTECQLLTTYINTYTLLTYRLTVTKSEAEKLKDPSLWPEGTRMKPYIQGIKRVQRQCRYGWNCPWGNDCRYYHANKKAVETPGHQRKPRSQWPIYSSGARYPCSHTLPNSPMNRINTCGACWYRPISWP